MASRIGVRRIERRRVIRSNAVQCHPYVWNCDHLVLAGTHDLTRNMLRTLRNLCCVWLILILRGGCACEEENQQYAPKY
jgi:hypothetical protein